MVRSGSPKVSYRGIRIQSTVASINEEIQMRLWALLKSDLVGLAIKPMLWEEFVFAKPDVAEEDGDDDGGPHEDCIEMWVAAEFIRGCRDCRVAVNKLLEAEEVTVSDKTEAQDIDRVKSMLMKNRGVWLADDAFFSLELAVMTLIGAVRGVDRVNEAILRTFPGETAPLEGPRCRASAAAP